MRNGLSIQELAEASGVTQRQVARDLKDGAPKTSVADFLEWRKNNRRPKSPKAGQIAEETGRLRAAQADDAELELAKKRGRLIECEDVRLVLSAASVVFSSQLDALSGRKAAQLAAINEPAMMRHELREETNQIRRAVSAELEKLAVQFDGEPDRAAAEPDAGPVGGPVPDPADGEC